mgnify:CR=1 FL=1
MHETGSVKRAERKNRKGEEEMKKNTRKIWIGVIALVAVAIILGVVYKVAGPKAQQGSKSCTLEVVDDNGDTTTYELSTDVEYLRELMDEAAENEDFSYEGEDGDYGLYIETVNGLTADYDTDGAYWAIYVNGEYGQNSADLQPVADGDTYRLSYEVSSGE